MRAQLVVGLSVLVAACTFPDVASEGTGGSTTTSTSTTPTTTSGTVDPTTSTSTSTSGGEGGAPATTSAMGGGGSTGTAGGSTSSQGGAGGAGGAGGTDPGGNGTCPVGSDGEGCEYRDLEGNLTETDCDRDGLLNPDDPCQPCDASVPWAEDDDVFTDASYVTLDGEPSWDWNCDGDQTFECGVGSCPAVACKSCYYPAAPASCGQPNFTHEICGGGCSLDGVDTVSRSVKCN